MSFPSKFAGTCAGCGKRFPAGALIEYDRTSKKARHPGCAVQGALREPGDESEPSGEAPRAPGAVSGPRRPRRAKPSGEIAGPRVAETDLPDAVSCEHCGGTAAMGPMIHVACAQMGETVPF